MQRHHSARAHARAYDQTRRERRAETAAGTSVTRGADDVIRSHAFAMPVVREIPPVHPDADRATSEW